MMEKVVSKYAGGFWVEGWKKGGFGVCVFKTYNIYIMSHGILVEVCCSPPL